MNKQIHNRNNRPIPTNYRSLQRVVILLVLGGGFNLLGFYILYRFNVDSGSLAKLIVSASTWGLAFWIISHRIQFDELNSKTFLKSTLYFLAIFLIISVLDYQIWVHTTPNHTLFDLIVIIPVSWVFSQIIYNRSALHPSHLTITPDLPTLPIPRITPPDLYLGEATGYLQSLSHGSGISPAHPIILNTEDATQNILVLGGIGSGKTTCIMYPLLFQLLKKGYGGLIFDIKGDFLDATFKLAEEAKRDKIIVFGPGHQQMNLLSGLSPEIAASFLKSAFLLSGGSRSDSFWIDTATDLCRNALGILSFLPQHYSLEGLRSYIFDEDLREKFDAQVREKLPELNERQTRLLRSYLNYHESIFSRFDEKVVSGVNATVSQVLSSFDHPDLVDAFCRTPPPKDGYKAFQLEDILLPFIVFIDLPLAKWGLSAKVVYTFIKLRFFNIMQRRYSSTEYNYTDPIFFMCDEYQEIISANKDGLSDLNFWDKSRSSKTIGIISTQSLSSIYASINNRDLANAILQNFRQKICFRTEDQATIDMFHRLLGRVEVEKIGSSFGGSNSRGGFSNSSHSQQWSENVTTIEKSVLDPQLIRNLHKGQALALLSINGKSHDDVINTTPKYV